MEPSIVIIGGVSFGTTLSLIIYIIRASIQYGALKTKVDTMWAFQMRRAISEVTQSGIGTMNSPIRFTEDAIARLDPIRDELIELYQKDPDRDDDAKMLLDIEQKFGDVLLNIVCIPCGLSHGACLILAMSVAKQTDNLQIHL